MRPLALLGLGSNLGDRKANLDGAISALRQMPGVNLWDVSSYHETAPVGGPAGQGAFLNAVATAQPTIGPRKLLGVLLEIEDRFGRVRTVRWGERTLDLDLLLYGDEILETPELTLPHPRFALRRFVLAPANEVAPRMVEPWTERTVADLLANLDRRPSSVALDHPGFHMRSEEVADQIGQVYRLLLERSGSEGRLWADLLQDSMLTHFPWKTRFTEISSVARRMSAGRLSRQVDRDRWLVTGFCLNREIERQDLAIRCQTFGKEHSLRAVFRTLGQTSANSAVRRAVEPSFIVVVGEGGASPGDRARRFPVLIPQSHDPEQIVTEIVATCAATRS